MLCAIAIIDPASTERLAELENATERFDIPPQDVHGHITLATYTGDDEEVFISSCKSILSGYGRFPVYYDTVGTWICKSGMKSFIGAFPRKEPVIMTIQREIAGRWSAYLNEWTQADSWRPHTSLLYVSGVDLSAVAEAMQREFEPFAAQIDRIEFTRVFEDEDKCSFETVCCIELQ